LKVLFLTPWYPTQEKPNWGVFVREHALALHKAGVEVELWALCLVPDKANWQVKFTETTDRGILEKQLIVKTRFQKYIYNLPALQRFFINKYFADKLVTRPQLIIGNVGYPAGMWARELSQRWGVPYLLIEHWSGVHRFLSTSIWGYKLYQAYQGASQVLAVSEFLKGQLSNLKLTRTLVIPNVVDTAIYSYQPKQRIAGTVHFCSAQELGPPKLPFLMLEALDLFQKKTGLRVIYTFVGGGIWEKELLEKAAKTSLEFALLPRQEKPALAKVIQQSDFLIHASSYETFGLIALEALATGTPVITSNLPSLEEFVIEGRGFCSENVASHFVAILEKLVSYPFQNQTISEEISKQYSAEAVGNSLLAIAKRFAKPD